MKIQLKKLQSKIFYTILKIFTLSEVKLAPLALKGEDKKLKKYQTRKDSIIKNET